MKHKVTGKYIYTEIFHRKMLKVVYIYLNYDKIYNKLI